jgi:glycosyltransferase involved in cell wall biosynthesis
VLSEAAAAGTPIVASRIDCTEGLLGSDHPGLFPVGDERALSILLQRAEQDPAFLRELTARSIALGSALSPAAETRAWQQLLALLTSPPEA